jgi:flavin reductase (DIM6/NTAB) family NADH-FMN oxidoreductase RutF
MNIHANQAIMAAMRPQPPADVRARAPNFDAPHFRQALSRFATGVTVVTTRAPDGRAGESASHNFVGMTANSFNSVSMAPPLVLWSLGLQARSLPLFHGQSHYVINVLSADQLEVCQRFAYGQGDRFAQTPYRLGESGLPILEGCLAWFECHNRSRYDEGDHVIFVGEVERCGFADTLDGLVFQGGRFGHVNALPDSPV